MRIAVREEEFELLPDRCLYWPSQKLLAVADVHLGKAETFQQQGLWLPADPSGQDLSTLSKVIAGRSVRQVFCLRQEFSVQSTCRERSGHRCRFIRYPECDER